MQKFITELSNDNTTLANILISQKQVLKTSENHLALDDLTMKKSLENKTKEISTLISKCDKLMKTVDQLHQKNYELQEQVNSNVITKR
jgi:hypothetical protein